MNKELKENRKKYYQDYYKNNKDKYLENAQKWQKNNKDKYLKSIQKSRRKRVEKLREQGITNAWNVVLYGKEPKYKVVEINDRRNKRNIR